MTKSNGVTVQSLEIKNFLGIKELSFTPDGKFNFITGRNGAGKTSVLRALDYAFNGKERGTEDLDYIHNGADKAEILVDMGQFSINRRITKSGNYVDVEKDGMKYQSPATILKAMAGPFSFNPMDFAFCEEKERNGIVLKSMAIEYTLADAKKDGVLTEAVEKEISNLPDADQPTGLELVDYLYDYYYAKRAEVKKWLDNAKTTKDELEKTLPEKFVPFNKENYDKLREAIENQREIIKKAQDDQDKVLNDNEKVGELWESLKGILEPYGDGEVHYNEGPIRARVKETTKEVHDAKEAMEKLQDQEETQRESMEFAQTQAQIDDYSGKIPKGEKTHKDLEAYIKSLRGEIKQNLIAKADMGIDGLAFEEGRFTVGGVPVENLSDSEKLRVGVKIAEKTAGKLDFIFIDGVERLDPETLKDFVANLEASKFQYFFTTCQPSPEGVNAIKMEKPKTVVQNAVLEDVQKNEEGEIVQAELVAVTTKK